MDFFNIHTHASRHPESEILSTDIHSFPPENEGIYLSVGIHPWYLSEEKTENQLQALQRAVKDNRVIAIGESGLDRLQGPSLDIQTNTFNKIITLSEAMDLPIIIHCVKAFNELIRIKQEMRPQQPWIVHGFRGKAPLANELIRHGFWLSFGATFQTEIDAESVKNHLFIETDESETPIEDIYQSVASNLQLPLEELKEAIKMNVKKVFFKA